MRMKAFPTLADNGHITTQDGMDLRDWFAGQVLCGISSVTNVDWGSRDHVAKICYALADAMMEARKDD